MTVEQNFVDAVPFDKAFEVIAAISPSDSCIFGRVTEALEYEDRLYVSDEKSISVFDMDGNYLWQLRRLGRGPQEYSKLHDFTVHDGMIYVLSNTQKMLAYDLEGRFCFSREIDFFASAISCADSCIVLLAACQMEGNKFHFYDSSNLEELSQHEAITDAELTYKHLMEMQSFYEKDGKTYFYEMFNNRIYELTANFLKAELYIDFYGKNPPDGFFKTPFENVVDITMRAAEHDYCYGMLAFAGDKDHFVCIYKDADDNRFCIHDENESDVQSDRLEFDGVDVPVNSVKFFLKSEKSMYVMVPSEYFVDKEEQYNAQEGSLYRPRSSNPLFLKVNLKE